VMAVHYPKDMNSLFSMDLFPDMATEIQAEMISTREKLLAKVQGVVDESDHEGRGVSFRAFVGPASTYRPAYALCEDAKVAEVKPYRVYVGYDNDEHHRTFTDYVVRHAPCDVAIIKSDFRVSDNAKGLIRWVGISERNFDVSGAALAKAFYHSKFGDTVVAVHYPVNPFEAEGLSSVYCEHFSSMAEQQLEVIVDDVEKRVLESARRIAEIYQKSGVEFKTLTGDRTQEPHLRLVMDATTSYKRPGSIYVGYNRRRDRTRLVDPHKLYDVAEFVVRNAPCNVVVVKETQEEMAARVKSRRAAEGAVDDRPNEVPTPGVLPTPAT